MLYSGVCQKWIKLEKTEPFRYRLNLMLHWQYGWFKSTLLEQVAGWFPFDANTLTSSSAAAIRGSFVEGQFFCPELLLSDLLVIGEFTSILKSDDETLGALLVALEEGFVRVALIKAGKATDKAKAQIKKYGGRFIDNRLEYRNKAVVWVATHTIDNIRDSMRDAFTSRFYTIHVPPSEIPLVAAWNDLTELQDIDFECEIGEWLDKIISKKSMPDHVFEGKVIKILKNGYITDKVMRLPREVGDIRRMTLAHHEIFPKDGVGKVAIIMKHFLDSTAGTNTSREKIVLFIFQNPKSFKEIEGYTGLSKSNIFNHLKRMGAQKVGHTPVKYFLDESVMKKKKTSAKKKSVKKRSVKK